jgi:hypothetical protein
MRPLRFLEGIHPEMTPGATLRAFWVAAVLFAPLSPAQEPQPTFKTSVALVRVDVEAVASSGGAIAGLTRENFRVLDDGVEQPVSGFSFEEEPLDLILLFDHSGGMKGKLLELVRAVELGFHELKTGDRVCVMAFQRDAEEFTPFLANLGEVNEAILLKVLELPFRGNSNVESAAAAAAVRFRVEPSSGRRRAVLVVTDKAGGNSQATVRELWKSNAVLSELVIGNARAVSPIADRTGGTVVLAGPAGPSFQRAIRSLRRRYTLYYAAPEGQTGSERRVEVQLKSPGTQGAIVHARSGYSVP